MESFDAAAARSDAIHDAGTGKHGSSARHD
jgi:hypothetical protein